MECAIQKNQNRNAADDDANGLCLLKEIVYVECLLYFRMTGRILRRFRAKRTYVLSVGVGRKLRSDVPE